MATELGVSVHWADAETDDPVVENFLSFLARDLRRRPEATKPLSKTLVARIASLIEGIVADPADEIDGEVAL